MTLRALRIFPQLFLLVALACLSGCALSRQKELFPEIYAMETLPAQLDLVVDVTVLSDLDDKDLGVDLQRNRAAADHMLERISGIMTNAGYQLNTVRSGYGLVWRPGAEAVYLAENKKTTGVSYPGPEPLTPGDPWIENAARDFLQTLVMAARARRNHPEDIALQQPLWALAHSPLPAALAQLPSRYLLVANMTVYDATALKEAASVLGGFAFGAGMAALGSTLVLVPILRTSYSYTELVLYDTRTGDIAWSSSFCAPDDANARHRYALGEAAATFPAHAGHRAKYPSRVTSR
jgi:hypothetical protein